MTREKGKMKGGEIWRLEETNSVGAEKAGPAVHALLFLFGSLLLLHSMRDKYII